MSGKASHQHRGDTDDQAAVDAAKAVEKHGLQEL